MYIKQHNRKWQSECMGHNAVARAPRRPRRLDAPVGNLNTEWLSNQINDWQLMRSASRHCACQLGQFLFCASRSIHWLVKQSMVVLLTLLIHLLLMSVFANRYTLLEGLANECNELYYVPRSNWQHRSLSALNCTAQCNYWIVCWFAPEKTINEYYCKLIIGTKWSSYLNWFF